MAEYGRGSRVKKPVSAQCLCALHNSPQAYNRD